MIGHNNVKVVNITAIMCITKIKSNETVELIEINIGEKLASQITDDNTAVGRLIEKTFSGRKLLPISA